jgi:mannose-6-phosphate isomerase-like protein (cupin superfamily)
MGVSRNKARPGGRAAGEAARPTRVRGEVWLDRATVSNQEEFLIVHTRLVAAALLFAGLALPAGDPTGFQMWTSSELQGFSKSLAPKINAQKLATQQLGGQGNYSFLMVHRQGDGEAEFHATQADIFTVQDGHATLVYGGKMVDAKTTAPNEMRGPSISGGQEKRLGPGDVVAIPAKTPHQVKLAPGAKEFTYFVVKVTQ